MSRGWLHPTVIYIISTAMRSGLPDGLVFWVYHGVVRSVYPTVYELPRVVRLVLSNGYILFPRP